MEEHSRILTELASRIRSSLGTRPRQELDEQRNHLTIQFGGEANAILGVEVDDAIRPSFRVSFPELKVKRNGDRHIKIKTQNGVLVEGVEWITLQLAKHGQVQPEFLE
jgi:hypothetical protein